MEVILKSLVFNKYLENKIFFNLSKGQNKNVYFKIDDTHFCLSFELREGYDDFYLKTFYIFDKNNTVGNDLQSKLLKDSTNIKYIRLVNNINFYLHD